MANDEFQMKKFQFVMSPVATHSSFAICHSELWR
jgi:hypothetical protein